MSKKAGRSKDDSMGVDGDDKDGTMLDQGFDRFLSRELHRLYDSVLNEAIPEDLALLLQQFDERPKKPSDVDDKG
jgi:hypothetical protein